MHFVRQFCDPGAEPYSDVAVRQTRTTRKEQHVDIVAPADWPLSTACAVADLAFDRFAEMPAAGTRTADLPPFLRAPRTARTEDGAVAVLEVLDRLAARWSGWGWRLGFFDQAEDAEAFFDDVRWLLAQRALAPDSSAWTGLSDAPRLLGFGVDPFTGKTLPAHSLPDFAPIRAGSEEAGAVGNVVRLIRDTVETRAAKPAKAAPPAPAVTLDLMRFIGHSGALDAAALAAATRLATLIAEIELSTRLARSEAEARSAYANRPIAVGPANLGAFLMAQGLAHDSDAGRALAQATVGLITAATAAMSGEIAAEAGACPAFTAAKRPLARALKAQSSAMQRAVARVAAIVRPAHLETMAAEIARIAEPLWTHATAAAGQGLRHSRFTALHTAGGAGPVPLALQSVGAKALPALVIDQELGNGHMTRMVTPAVTAGLAMLAHGVAVQAAAIRHLRGRRSLAGAPGVSLEALRAKGLDEAALARVEAAVMETSHIRYAVNRWVIGGEVCDTVLGLDPILTQDYGFDMLAALGFTADEIEAANRYCLGTDGLDGLPGLAEGDAQALALPGDAEAAMEAEAAMVRALNLVISHPAPLPEDELAAILEESPSAAPAHALAAAERS